METDEISKAVILNPSPAESQGLLAFVTRQFTVAKQLVS